MEPDVEGHALDLLRDQPSRSLPLRRLHRTLVAEVGPGIGSVAQLALEVRRRTDLFVVIEPQDPLGETMAWPSDLRAAYEEALHAAGLERDPRIALAREPLESAPDALCVADRTLVELWSAAREDAEFRNRIAAAIAQLDQVRRSLHSAVE